jgi:hypothetical protein
MAMKNATMKTIALGLGIVIPFVIQVFAPYLVDSGGEPRSIYLVLTGIIIAFTWCSGRHWEATRRQRQSDTTPIKEAPRDSVVEISDWGGNRLPGAPRLTHVPGAWIGMWEKGAKLNERRVLYLPAASTDEAVDYAKLAFGAVQDDPSSDLPDYREMAIGQDRLVVKPVDAGVDPFIYPSEFSYA